MYGTFTILVSSLWLFHNSGDGKNDLFKFNSTSSSERAPYPCSHFWVISFWRFGRIYLRKSSSSFLLPISSHFFAASSALPMIFFVVSNFLTRLFWFSSSLSRFSKSNSVASPIILMLSSSAFTCGPSFFGSTASMLSSFFSIYIFIFII